MNKASLLASIAILVSGPITWYVGWMVWDLLELWHHWKLSIYQNLLYALVFGYLASALLVWRWKTGKAGMPTQNVPIPPVAPKAPNNPQKQPPTPAFEKMEGRIKEILEKQADTHSIMKYLKKKEEKQAKAKKTPAPLPPELIKKLAEQKKLAEKTTEEAKKSDKGA